MGDGEEVMIGVGEGVWVGVGEEVMIEYVGKVKNPKTGREYHDFKVFTREVPFTEVGGTQDDEEDDGVPVDEIPF